MRIVKSASIHPAAYPPQVIHSTPQSAQPTGDFSTQVEAKVESTSSSQGNIAEILSPMVGTFYRAPAPDASPYVREMCVLGVRKDAGGSKLEYLHAVVAMKLMNEIEAEISGKIIKILVENGQPVEYNQPLFLVEKT